MAGRPESFDLCMPLPWLPCGPCDATNVHHIFTTLTLFNILVLILAYSIDIKSMPGFGIDRKTMTQYNFGGLKSAVHCWYVYYETFDSGKWEIVECPTGWKMIDSCYCLTLLLNEKTH